MCARGEEKEFILNMRSQGRNMTHEEWFSVGRSRLTEAQAFFTRLHDTRIEKKKISEFGCGFDGRDMHGFEWIVLFLIEAIRSYK